jgi:hypothetical protein
MNKISERLWTLMSMGLKVTGEYMESLRYIEEELTFTELGTLEPFYNWIEDGGKDDVTMIPKRSIGWGNYNERYSEYLGSK